MTASAPVTFRPAVAADALCLGVLSTQVFLDTYCTQGIRPELAREVLANHSVATYEALRRRRVGMLPYVLTPDC